MDVEQLRADPLHPYTRALLAALPELGQSREDALAYIPGEVPDPGDTPPPAAPERERRAPTSWLDEHDDEPTTTRAPRTERTTVAQPPRPRRTSGEGPVDDDLDVDEPAEYRPPPRKR